MELKGDWKNVESKEKFMYYLLTSAFSTFSTAKKQDKISPKEYWDLWDDLCLLAKEHYDFDFVSFKEEFSRELKMKRGTSNENNIKSYFSMR